MNKKTAVIHQPDFLPYLGFFHRLLNCDVFVILDDVQFTNNSKECWHRRDKIKTPSGEKWITVGIQKTPLGTKICDVLLNQTTDWKEKNINMIVEHYRRAPFYDEIIPYIQELYSSQYIKMVDFNMKSIDILLKLFDINLDIVLASSLQVQGKSNLLLVDILRKLEVCTYLSGVGARAYFDPDPYRGAGIEVKWQDFKHPIYPQLYGEFIPYLSSIDLLFNCGIEKSRKILRSC